MAFNNSTRMKRAQIGTLTAPAAGGATTLQLPKSGLLARLYLHINYVLAGAGAVPNPLGMSSAIRRVRLTLNSGIQLVDISGPGYSYLMMEGQESAYHLGQIQHQGRVVVANGTYNLDMVLDVQINQRDPIGLIMLQNEETLATLTVDWEDPVTVNGAGSTATATCDVVMEWFTVPAKVEDWPPLNLVHQYLEETRVVAGAGQVTYDVPRGNTYLALYHGLGIAVAGADGWSAASLRVNQSDFLEQHTPSSQDQVTIYQKGRARPLGGIFYDFLGASGMGSYGTSRDLFNSALVTSMDSVITATGAGTLYTLRRQLVSLS